MNILANGRGGPPKAVEWGFLLAVFLLTGAADKAAIVAEMRTRGILSAAQAKWTPNDWSLLVKSKKAEAEGAVDYLVSRVRKIATLVAIDKRPDGTQKLLLTPAGYERYHFFKSQDAIRAFETRGIALKEVFHLTDLSGRPFFAGAGLLTDEGEAAYDAIRRGEAPKWKFDWEPVKKKRR